MKFLEGFFGSKKDGSFTNKDIDNVNRMLDVYNLKLITGEKGKLDVHFDAKDLIDRVGASTDDESFVGFWLKNAYNNPNAIGEQGKKERYRDYEFMKNDSPELGMYIDTVVTEAISYKLSTETLVNLKVTDKDGKENKEYSKFLNKRMSEFDFDDKQIIEAMTTYGNKYFTTKIEKNKINLEINISDPREVEIVSLESDVSRAKGYRLIDGNTEVEKLLPFNVINFDVSTGDPNIIPYGESLLERGRSTFKKLMIIETMLALSRSSKVDKLVIKYPVESGSSPMDMMNQGMRIRGMLKNFFTGSGATVKSQKKPYSFSDIIMLPNTPDKSFEIDRLPSGISLAEIEDVEYFWEKLIASTHMPRSYFRPDDKYEGYRKLSLQDLRFARLISNVLYNYSRAYVTLGKLILVVEKEVESIHDYKVIAEYQQVTPISVDQLDSISRGIETVNALIEALKENLGVETVPKSTLKTLLQQFTMLPVEIIDELFRFTDSKIDIGMGEVPEEPEGDEEEPNKEPDEESKDNFTEGQIKLVTESLKVIVQNNPEKIVSSQISRVHESETNANYLAKCYLEEKRAA